MNRNLVNRNLVNRNMGTVLVCGCIQVSPDLLTYELVAFSSLEDSMTPQSPATMI